MLRVSDAGQEERLAGRAVGHQHQVGTVEPDLGGSTRAAVGSMPTAVAALATVPFSPTPRVAACSTRPMQHACVDSPVKSAAG